MLVTYMCHNLVIIIMLENNEQNTSHNDNAMLPNLNIYTFEAAVYCTSIAGIQYLVVGGCQDAADDAIVATQNTFIRIPPPVEAARQYAAVLHKESG